MDPNILQSFFDPIFPISGNYCLNVFSERFPDYKNYSNNYIFVGHYEIIDFLTGNIAKSRPSVGISTHLTSLGKKETYCEWVFDYIYFLPIDEDISTYETNIFTLLEPYKLKNDLYYLSIEETIQKVKSILS
jgi:hypothetical protein